MRFDKPTFIFDREPEWAELSSFISAHSRLGVVWGPRRAGKSVLLSAAAEEAGGLYYEAVRQDPALSLADIGRTVGKRLGAGPVMYRDWDEALSSLLTLPNCPVVVIDEFGYLCEASPELPSVVQRVIDTSRRAGGITGQRAPSRLIICGSAVARLSHLLDRDQPLFGRAQLAQVIDAFDFRAAARFWGVADLPALAVQLHAVVGGLPGYRDVVVDAPRSIGTFSKWIIERVIAPSSPLLEEDALVLQASGLEANIYRSILTAVARGDQTPSGVASRIGRPASALARPFDKLTEAGLLDRIADPLRSRRSRYELADAFLVFHDAIIRPNRTRLRRRAQAEVWAEAEPTWHAGIVGPHFERICRQATFHYPREFGFGGVAAVGSTVVADPVARRNHELDVVATRSDGQIVAIGEAKHTAASRGIQEVERLAAIRALLPNPDDRDCVLAVFSANGFTPELVKTASERQDVELIDLNRLYGRA